MAVPNVIPQAAPYADPHSGIHPDPHGTRSLFSDLPETAAVPPAPPSGAPPSASKPPSAGPPVGPAAECTLDEVADRVASDDAGKWDAVAPCRHLLLHEGRLYFPQAQQDGHDSGLTLTPWALGQACQKLGLPAAYIRRCPPRLQDANFNEWNRRAEIGRRLGAADGDPDAAWLLRCKGAHVRGVLSDRYARLDNRQLLDALLPVLREEGCGGYGRSRLEVGLCRLSAESFHLRLVDRSVGRDVLPGDRLIVGVHLANSEVGFRAVTVDALVYRLVCANGLIRRVDSRSLLRQKHLHVSEPRFAALLADALREAVAVAAGFMEQLALAAKTPVPDPEGALGHLAVAWDLPERTAGLVRAALESESRPDTLYGLVNALT